MNKIAEARFEAIFALNEYLLKLESLGFKNYDVTTVLTDEEDTFIHRTPKDNLRAAKMQQMDILEDGSLRYSTHEAINLSGRESTSTNAKISFSTTKNAASKSNRV